MEDRLDYNEDGKTLDEVVMYDALVHLEQMDDTYFMLIVENKQHRWHLRIGSRSGMAKVDAWVFEKENKLGSKGE